MTTMSDNEIRDGIAGIEALLATLVKLQMAPILEHELRDPFGRKLWDLTGKATIRKIQKTLKCSPNRISDTWARWEKSGLIKKDGNSYQRNV